MALFEPGGYFPPEDSIERLAKYKRMKKLFDGKHIEVYERASKVLKDSPHAEQLKNLYIAVNIADIITVKPADLLVGEPPAYESGLPDDSDQQKAINRYVEENDLNQIIHESAIGAGIRGDSWIKVRYGYRQDFSELDVLGLERPADAKMEPVIEHVNAECVFPETATGDVKKFKAINIAMVEWVETPKKEIPFLNVERHVPGYIIYERYRLVPTGANTEYGVPIDTFYIEEKVPTGRDEDIVETGLSHIPVFHIPYKSVDSDWEGVGGLEKLETVFAAINDRLVTIDYVIQKHSDPNAYGPELEGTGDTIAFGGKYIPVTKDDVAPAYMTWDGKLEAAFKELELLLGIVYQMSETPQWLFGTIVADNGNASGAGTSHTDGIAIRMRMMPILSKVKRIRAHFDKAIRDALWTCQLFDTNFGGYDFEPIYPTINWKDGVPRDEKELAEVMSIRTGGKPTIDVASAIKKLDEVDDEKAKEIMRRIEEDEKQANGFVDSSIFNQ
jgi:Phage portal protein, SPP1 Gp6-like